MTSKNSRKTDKKGQWDKINMVFGAYTTGFLERSVVFNQEGYTASSSDASSESDEEEPSPLCAPPLYEPVDALEALDALDALDALEAPLEARGRAPLWLLPVPAVKRLTNS